MKSQLSDSAITFKKVNKYFYLQNQRTLKELLQAIFVRQKTHERVHALQDISFDIKKGETVGIIGKNGAGKSTLLKMIAGVTFPTSGEVNIHGKVSPLIELGAGFHPELTGKENIFLNGVILGMDEDYLVEKFQEIVDFSGLDMKFIYTPVKHYSSGMYMRLAFAVAIYTKPDVLLIDEILAVGDTAFQEKCMNKLEEYKAQGVTTVYVSHAMESVRNFCNRVIYLQHGKVIFDGDVNEGVDMYLKD